MASTAGQTIDQARRSTDREPWSHVHGDDSCIDVKSSFRFDSGRNPYRRTMLRALNASGNVPESEMRGNASTAAEITLFKQLVVAKIQLATANAKLRQYGERQREPTIETATVCGFTVPASARDLIATIEDSRYILALEDNWDDEGSPGYLEATWCSAIKLLTRIALEAKRRNAVTMPVPRIHNGPDGSIDLHWKLPNRELLINVSPDASMSPSYYGDDLDGSATIEGTLNRQEVNSWVALWLLGQ